MTPTKEELKQLYDECNQKYFWGKLGKCGFMFFSINVGFLGWCNTNEDKNGKPKDRIWIGTCVEWTPEDLRRVMVHEMVHLYNVRVEKKWWRGLTGHGPCFRRQRRRLLKDFGIDILGFENLVYRSKKIKPPKKWERIFQRVLYL